MTQHSWRHSSWIPLILWILTNFLGLILATGATFILYAHLGLNTAQDEYLRLFWGLLLCGAVQGSVFGGLQSIVLLGFKLMHPARIVQCLFSTAGCMGLGLAIPSILVLSLAENWIGLSIEQAILAGWVMSWIWAGLSWGAIAGGRSAQKVRWSLINMAAYSLWAFVSIALVITGAAVLDEMGQTNLSAVAAIIVGIFCVGSGLNIFLIGRLIQRKQLIT